MLKSLNKLKWKDIEAEFGTKVDKIEEEAKVIKLDRPDFVDEPIEPNLINLIDSHPHLAVLEGWKSLENSITNLSIAKLDTDKRLPFQQHLNAIQKAELLPDSMARTIRDIREVRNRAAHDVDNSVSKGNAYILLDTIADISGYLRKLANN